MNGMRRMGEPQIGSFTGGDNAIGLSLLGLVVSPVVGAIVYRKHPVIGAAAGLGVFVVGATVIDFVRSET